MSSIVARTLLSNSLAKSVSKSMAAKSLMNKTSPLVPTAMTLQFTTQYTQPMAMGNPHFDEDSEPILSLHLEAMDRWRSEGKALYKLMVTDDVKDEAMKPQAIADASKEQVDSLLQEMIDNDQLDPRLSWTTRVDY